MTEYKQDVFAEAHKTLRITDTKSFLRNLLPNGRVEGNEYLALNPTRIDHHYGSFRINITTGKWADFATGDKGGDLISLYAYVKGMNNYVAACEIAGIQPSNRRG
jgi:hypothetical protein